MPVSWFDCNKVHVSELYSNKAPLRLFSCDFTAEHPRKPAFVLFLIKFFLTKSKFSTIFFLSRFPFTDTNDSHDGRKGKEGDALSSSPNISTFIFNFTSETTPLIFNCFACNYWIGLDALYQL